MDEISGVLAAIDYRGFYKRHIPKFEANGNTEVSCPCPFHKDENPSLSVNVETGLFNCFGCGEKGNVIQFVQKRYDIGFKEALERIKSDCGLQNADCGKKKSEAQNPKSEIRNKKQETRNRKQAGNPSILPLAR